MAFLKKISSPDPDHMLVDQYKTTGDMEILAGLYQRYMDLLYGVCLKYLEDPDEAKDAVFSIYEELIQKLKKYEVTYFRGWVYQLARNYCLMKLRSQRNFTVNIDPDFMYSAETMHPDAAIEKETNLQNMEECIDLLGSEQKQTIRLFYLQEKSYREIAGITGMEINQVRSFIQNGRRNLKICMEKKALEKA